MDLKLDSLACSKEKVYFVALAITAFLLWILILVTIVGIFYAAIVILFLWFGQGLLVAYLRTEAVSINEKQMSILYQTYLGVCKKLNLTKIPELYILQSNGILQAFATRHSARNFVVLCSDIVDALGEESDEVRFLIAHELGHVCEKHIVKKMFVGLALWIPLLAPAYSRACETTCDRYGIYTVNAKEGAVKAMMILSGGKNLGRVMSCQAFAEQYHEKRGFFVSWHELISPYPTLSRRVAYLLSIKEGKEFKKRAQHLLSYVFAFFSFGGGTGIPGLMVSIAFLALLAAIAIPNFLMARISANDVLAENTLSDLANASEAYALDNNGKYPENISALTEAEPAYKKIKYCDSVIRGFAYECKMSALGYEYIAAPVEEGVTGSAVFSITTGNIKKRAETKQKK